jgi:hypothetical protein
MDHAPLSSARRLALAGIGIGLVALLLTARGLKPDPRGFGTHEQLGLTPCGFYSWTGWPCPTCGATTAWAYVLRADFAGAMNANLAGTMLCLVAMVGVPWLLMSASLGRWWAVKPTPYGLLGVGSGLMVIAMLDWLRRVWFSH